LPLIPPKFYLKLITGVIEVFTSVERSLPHTLFFKKTR
jgi:hypothetical protein